MSKQLLAKIGVFALIVVNLGAYYVFWPDNRSRGPDLGKEGDSGKPLRMANNASAAPVGEPKKPSLLQGDVAPTVPPPIKPPDLNASLPAPPPPIAGQDPNPKPPPIAGDPLLPTIPTPGPPSAPPPVESIVPPAPPSKANDPFLEKLRQYTATVKDDKNSTAPDAKVDPVVGSGFTTIPAPPPPPPAAPPPAAPPLAPTVQAPPIPPENSPWSLQWEMANGQTTLTARLHKRLEVRITCERAKMDTPDGTVVALGKVSFIGGGVRGTCNRLIIGLAGDSLVLEGKVEVQIQQSGSPDFAAAGAELKGEQIALRLLPNGGAVPAQMFPAPPPPALQPANGKPPPANSFTEPRLFPLDNIKKGP
jgi:hypothetical protein